VVNQQANPPVYAKRGSIALSCYALNRGFMTQSSRSQLSVFDAVTIMVGLVVGIGIFRTPSIVAANVQSEWVFVFVWVVGGLATLLGALCYAELSAAHPHAGGEYHFLSRAYGNGVAILFGWARCTVIQTGAIAAVAFVLGDYAAQLVPLGPYGPGIYAALGVVLLTVINMLSTLDGKNLQVLVTWLELGAIVVMILCGLFGASADAVPAAPVSIPPASAALGMAMIFVLLTYGGWNEAAYLAGELKDAQRNISKVLVLGTAVLVTLYVLLNWALLSVLGLDGMRRSDVVASDMMRVVAGRTGELAVTLAIVGAAISTLNATIFTGARAFYAMGHDLTPLRWVGIWNVRGKTPRNSLAVQGVIALALIAVGVVTRDGFKTMVDYTAPVFWGFLLLVGFAVFVLRRRETADKRPYQVPLYPLPPILFCLICAYMFYASVSYTGEAALMGLLVLALGTPLLWFRRAPNT